MSPIISACIVVAGAGLVLGIGLGIASVVLKVKVNETEQKILEVLPGANCGSCSFAGCADYAKALATGKVKIGLCPVGGEEVAKKIAAILGTEEVAVRKKVAFVSCNGNNENLKKAVNYQGEVTCLASNLLISGEGSCAYGCNGFGDCVKVCKFSAISVKDGVAVVDCAKCTGCGMCVKTCPKKMISLVFAGNVAKLRCKNCDKGAETRKACVAGCIGCGKCVKECEVGAVSIQNNLAVFDSEKCIGCGKCADACPVKCIVV